MDTNDNMNDDIGMTELQEKTLLDNDIEIVEDDKIEKCFDCPLNRVCIKAFECKGKLTASKMKKIECYYENHGEYNKKRQLFNKWQAFVDIDPKYFMEKMMVNFDILEDEARKDYSFAKGMQLQYLLMSIHKMKFGERNETRHTGAIVNASVDIKQLLDKVRDEK